ncbi:serine hydrolase domain-containing protein [Paucibacter sp. R3-3]|uniref:Serine hydrolase domain-containing protein n=1 Tax=Roseateles agri TaxID=3098619 RepID=A0ABU5DAS3_9BURK|nr:serine hydrolase domain-containing protein [Paucibacter sp. R3-3]MDY0743366.1 serine hydrolase domain-containing protein [Paucibacter sp. R3-3]
MSDPIQAIDALLQPFNRSDAPGLMLGIRQHGRSLVRRAVGLASLELGVANTPRTRMRIASTSKHFTALAIMLLAEDGKLGIDDPIQRHLPELPALSPKGPTLRQLMNHTGGWRGHDELWTLAHGMAQQPTGMSLGVMARQRTFNAEPGTRMLYSNGGYRMLAMTIERLSGLSFAEFLRMRIFAPLGMLDTESVASDLDVRPGMATLYVPELSPAGPTGGWRRGVYPCEFEGSGSLVSTLDDMLVWLAHMRSERKTVGSAATWEQILAPTTLASGEVLPYGFGLVRHAYRGIEVIHHNGAVLGGSSQMITVPAHGLDIMILANGAPVAPAQLAFKCIDALLDDALQESPVPRAAASAYGGLVGQRYHAPGTGKLVAFGQAGDRLGLSWMGGPPLPLRERSGGLFLDFLDVAQNSIAIDFEGVGVTTTPPPTLTLREGGELQLLQRLPETPPDTAVLAPQLCGHYRSDELDADAQIEYGVDGQLLMTLQGRYGRLIARLNPFSDTVMGITPTDLLIAALGASNIVNIERNASGAVTGLRYDSARTRGLRFVRKQSNVQ